MVEHLKEVGWAFFLVLLYLIGITAPFGSSLGFETVCWVCLGFALIIAAIFLMILLSELLFQGIIKLVKKDITE